MCLGLGELREELNQLQLDVAARRRIACEREQAVANFDHGFFAVRLCYIKVAGGYQLTKKSQDGCRLGFGCDVV